LLELTIEEVSMKSLVRRLFVWGGAVSIALCSMGCSNTAIGMKEDAEENGKKAAVKASEAADKASQAAAVAAHSATEAAEAAAQTLSVKTALISDKRVTAKGIDVDTDRTTKTVILKGHVPDETQKTIAEQIAIVTASGYHVRNELTIGN
jgi:osmotically-inducible protein OsmY